MFWNKKKKIVDPFKKYQKADLVKMNRFYLEVVLRLKIVLENTTEDFKKKKEYNELNKTIHSLMSAREYESRHTICFFLDKVKINQISDFREIDMNNAITKLIQDFDNKRGLINQMNIKTNKIFEDANILRNQIDLKN